MKSEDILENHIKNSQEDLEIQPRMSSFGKTMEKLEREKRKRRGMYLSLFSGLLLLGIIAAYTLRPSHAEDVRASVVVPTTTPMKAEQKPENPTSHREAEKGKADQSVVKSTLVTPASPSTPPSVQTQIISSGITHSNQSNAPKEEKVSVPLPEEKVEWRPKIIRAKDEENLVSMPVIASPLLAVNTSDSLDMNIRTGILMPDKAVEKGTWSYCAGISFQPELTRYDIQKQPGADQQNSFSDDYLNNKKVQNVFHVNYGGELKLGLSYKGKWEFLLGCGYQRTEYEERPLNPSIPVYSTVSGGGVTPNLSFYTLMPGPVSAPIKNTFEYLSTSLSCNRLMNVGLYRLKVGAGLRSDYLLRANVLLLNSPYYYTYAEKYHGSELNKWVFTPQFNLGVMRDLSDRFQVQVCSTLFYSANSMFNNNYLITQKSYGTGLECILLYKFP
jgi:hypothetical protein